MVTPASNDQVDCGPNGFQPALNAWIANNGGMLAQDMCGSVTYTNSLLSSTSGCGNTGTYTYEFTATDECGMSVSSSATFTVVDTQGPVLSGVPASTSQSCELPLPAVPNVTADDCDTNPITVTYSQTITPVNANTTVETVTRTWTAQDNCGNVTTESQTITIFDNVHPVILNCPTGIGPVNTNGATCATVTWPQVGVADNCTVTSFTSNIQPGTCLPVGIHTVTYSATDAGGNGSSCSFDVEVVDNQSYCPVPDNGAMFYIHRFVFNGVTNTSGNNGGYADFSAISSTANAGGDLVMTFIPGSASGFNFPAYWSVFVDFNEDGDYTDAGELIFQRRGNGPFIWRVMLPGNIPAGAYSMRVYMHRYHFPQPCDDHQGLGEAEDYTLNIVPSPTRVAPTNELMEEQTRDLEVFAFENNLELEEMDAQSVSPDVNLYPNPTANWLYIDLADYSSENGEVSIFDSKGMTVMRIPFNANESQTLEINVASLPTGMYYARIMNGQKAITQKLCNRQIETIINRIIMVKEGEYPVDTPLSFYSVFILSSKSFKSSIKPSNCLFNSFTSSSAFSPASFFLLAFSILFFKSSAFSSNVSISGKYFSSISLAFLFRLSNKLSILSKALSYFPASNLSFSAFIRFPISTPTSFTSLKIFFAPVFSSGDPRNKL
ncbi:MAG: T9SS type A sorting domain-containing protein [Saprospiraceae bacterium]